MPSYRVWVTSAKQGNSTFNSEKITALQARYVTTTNRTHEDHMHRGDRQRILGDDSELRRRGAMKMAIYQSEFFLGALLPSALRLAT